MNNAVKNLKRISAAAKIASFFDLMNKVSSVILILLTITLFMKTPFTIKSVLGK